MPITAPVLSVEDNGDNTGATATLTGGHASATNTLKVQRWIGEIGTGEWSTSASRTGPGTLSLSLSAGLYWARCDSAYGGEAVVSNLVYFAVTTGAGSVHYQCLVAAQARIRGLELPGIADDSVLTRKLPLDRQIGPDFKPKLPCVLLTPMGVEQMNPRAGTNVRDDVGYPVLCSILSADNQKLELTDDRELKWRERIARAFRNQRLPGVSEVYTTVVEPTSIIVPDGWLKNVWAQGLILRFISREVRGVAG